MTTFAVTPQRTALVNIDLQNFFVDHTPGAHVVLARVNRLAAACRAAGILVVHTSHVLRPDGSNIGILAELFPEVATEGLLFEGARSAALHADLVIEPGDVLLKKPRFGAFHGSDLELILRGRGIDTIVISGISTDICCDTTAREANARDFRVLVVSDATATNPGDATIQEAALVQQVTLRIIDGMFGEVVTMDEILDRISPTSSPVRPGEGLRV